MSLLCFFKRESEKKSQNTQQLKKKTLSPLFMDGVQLPQGYSHFEGSLLFTTKSPEIPGTHFIDLGRMKG